MQAISGRPAYRDKSDAAINVSNAAPYEVLFLDFIGPFSPPSVGNIYLCLLIIMIPSGYAFKYDCTSSMEYIDCIEQLIMTAQRSNYSVKYATFRQDNQADFTIPQMRKLHDKHGIKVISGGPDEHEAQHLVENLAGQCNRRARAALLQAPHLDDTYFAAAVGFEIMVHNALPYKPNHWISPYRGSRPVVGRWFHVHAATGGIFRDWVVT